MIEYTEEDVHRYLRGEMPEGEKLGFENLLAVDDDLSRRLKVEEYIIKGIERKAEADLAKRVGSLVSARKRRRIWMYIAVGILAILVMGALWYSSEEEPKVEIDMPALYAQSFKRPLIRTGLRGDESESTLDGLRQLYSTREYDQILIFKDQNFSHPSAEDDLIFVVALMEKEQWLKAKQAIEMADASDPVYGDHLEWLGALIALRLDNLPDCISTLKLMAEQNGHDHQQDANTLLSHLE